MGMLTRLWKQTGLNALARNNYAKAEFYLRKVYSKEPDALGSRHNLAVALMGIKRYEEAEPLLLADIEQFGEELSRFRGIGDLYYLWGKAEKAGSWYEKALELCDTPPDELLLKHRVKKCSSPKAFADAQKSQEAFDEGNELIAQQRYKESIESFKRAVKLDNTNFLAWNNMGTILHLKLKDSSSALEAFTKASMYTSMPSLLSNLQEVTRALNK